MTDDIVTRLRNWDTSINEMLEAADEIERLRHTLSLTEKWRDNYKLAWDRCRGKAVRGDV